MPWERGLNPQCYRKCWPKLFSFKLIKIHRYANIPCDCGQYTRIFSWGTCTLNCMDALYFPTPTAEGNLIHPCNSRYRGKMFLCIDHQSHRIFVILYFNSKISNQNWKKYILISVSWYTKWDKQQEISSNLTALIIKINSTYAVKIKYIRHQPT